MKSSVQLAVTALAIAATLFAPAEVIAEPVTNGGFEEGLSGWYSTRMSYAMGSTAIATSGSPYQPLAGESSAFIVAMSRWPLNEEVTCERDPWNYACPLPIEFATSDAAPPSYNRWLNGIVNPYIPPYDYVDWYFRYGAYIARDVQVSVGDTLTWQWKRHGELAIGGIGEPYGLDNAWFIATNGSSVKRISIRSGAPASLTFEEGGLWSIYFGVQQTEDNQVWSALELDSVQLNSVPEPNSMALGLGAVIALTCVRRKSSKAAATDTNRHVHI